MGKVKLTLYMEEDTSKIAHRRARMMGKSISTIVKEYFLQKEKKAMSKEISDAVAEWVGVLSTVKTYKQLRNEIIVARLKRYEGAG